jgi:hypothetical protein
MKNVYPSGPRWSPTTRSELFVGRGGATFKTNNSAALVTFSWALRSLVVMLALAVGGASVSASDVIVTHRSRSLAAPRRRARVVLITTVFGEQPPYVAACNCIMLARMVLPVHTSLYFLN